ncbi:MAG: diguanylate cyclase [Gammaproteobacteria bacterium]|nr:GGDEF domain-containing protein [Gammaproteobacteria bacterium]NNJ92644.1 diguanylate cyclase [Gammaproteobacteria bacterium]
MSSAMAMRVAVRERAILLWHMTLLEDAFDRDELFETFYDYGSRYQQSRQKYLDSKLTESEKIYLVNLDKETSNRAPLLREFANNLMDDKKRDLYNDNLNQVLSDQIIVANILDDIIHLQQDQNEIARKRAAELISDILFQLIIWTILILVSGIFFARKVVQSSIRKNRLLEKANDDLERLARYDHLTGLPNRLFLLEHLELALPLATRNEYQCALFFIDLDGFKPINDTYGHEAGDEFLVKIGNRMKRVLRESDVLARLGGDEFVIVLFDIPDNSQALTVAEKLLLILSDKYIINGNEINASASIGICFFPEKQMNVEKLISRADSAMYKAKELGKNRYYINNPRAVESLGSVVK